MMPAADIAVKTILKLEQEDFQILLAIKNKQPCQTAPNLSKFLK